MTPSLVNRFSKLPTPVPIERAVVDAAQWQEIAAIYAENGWRLVSLWGSDRRQSEGHFVVCAAYATIAGLFWVELPLAPDTPVYPDISTHFAAANRMQRAVYDLLGLQAEGAADQRPWLRHGAWPADYFPLRHDNSGQEIHTPEADDYAFVSVEGDGVHEIPVGPVHAGIIEPGHFRFSIVGEPVLRLEERLGYKHKGIEKRFVGMSVEEGLKLAGRVSGDSTCAYAWAYCMAVESLANCRISERAQWLRALMLERERVANHLGDLGALGNDAAFGFGLAQFLRLKELWLRLNGELFGHRFMMDGCCPGGVKVDLDAKACVRIQQQCDQIEKEALTLRTIYDEHAGLQDRFLTLGRVTAERAAQLGLTGMAARASGIHIDLRRNFGWEPYTQLKFNIAGHRNGDVAARVVIRFDELFESLRLIRAISDKLPPGQISSEINVKALQGDAAGWIEGWRGEVLVALEVDSNARIRRCHCHDPSWQNWPALEHAIIGDIVPDFPLINKSFNLSYSGQDL